MKTRALSESAHAQVRYQDLRGAPSHKPPMIDAGGKLYRDPTRCDTCGAVYTRKTWRQPVAKTTRAAKRIDAVVGRCPACEQVRSGESFGTVLLRGPYALRHEEEIRRRARHVAERAGYTQPQRRIVSFRRTRSGLEVKTTSQKLAHRFARELEKAFRGRASLTWSDRDGRLTATWERILESDSP